jgi:hypothetical protein
MRRIIRHSAALVPALLVALAAACSDDSPTGSGGGGTQPISTWTSTRTIDFRNAASDIALLSGGNFVVVGGTSNFSTGGGITYGLTPEGGPAISTLELACPGADNAFVWAVVALDGGDFVIGGTCQVPSEPARYRFQRYTDQGVNVWSTKLDNLDASDFWDMIPTFDGGFLTAGRTPDGDMIAVKVNSVGEYEWDATVDLGTMQEEFRSVIAVADGYLAVGSGNGQAVWSMIESNGNVVWTRSHTAPGGSAARKILPTTGGEYVLFGNVDLQDDMDQNVWVARLNSAFTVADENKVDTGENGLDVTWSATPVGTSRFAVTGYIATSDRRAFLMLVDRDGQKIWSRYISDGNGDEGHAVIATPDGGFAVAGKDGTGPNESAFVVYKLNANGEM